MAVNKYIDTVTIAREAASSGTRPMYRAIAEALAQSILAGRIGTGTKLPPLRTLADALSVTVGTVNKAYAEIERQGLVTSRIGDGTYVYSPDKAANAGDFENAPSLEPSVIDLTRNAHIPSEDAMLMTETLSRLANDRRSIELLGEYQPEAGQPRHREAGARWIGLSGVEVSPDQIIATNGAQHALLCTMMATLRKDDLVLTEHLTYPGLVAAARALGIRLSGLPVDREGLIPESLEDACKQQRVHALYCTPTIQNPTTGVMSAERRHHIAGICMRHNIRIIEDDAHGVLVEPHPPSLASFAPSHTIVISSLSKAISSGLRVGFIAAPPPLVGRIAAAVRSSCWMATPLAVEVAARWILDGSANRLRKQQRTAIQRRKELVAPLLDGLEVRSHDDSYHYWIALPEPWRASEFERQLGKRGVLVKTAETFAVGRIVVPQYIRASISCVTEKELFEGFRQLTDAITEGPYTSIA